MGQSEAVHRTRHVHIREQDANVSVHPRRTVGVALISHGQLRVYVSTRPVDFRNYAEFTIMLSARRQSTAK